MSIPNLENCKKRKIWPKLYDFNTFCEPDCPISPTGPFRDNIRLFLQQCAESEDYKVEGMSIWCTFLVIESKNFVVPLYTIEEDVKKSVRPFCDLCRCNGKFWLLLLLFIYLFCLCDFWIGFFSPWNWVSLVEICNGVLLLLGLGFEKCSGFCVRFWKFSLCSMMGCVFGFMDGERWYLLINW